MTAQHIAGVLQILLGGVFLFAATSKLRRPAAFRATVARYDLVPAALVSTVAYLVLALELLLGIAFLTGVALWLAVPLGLVTLVAFGAATSVNLRRGNLVPCGCFGDDEEVISARSVVRVGLLTAALAGLAGLLTRGDVSAMAPWDMDSFVETVGVSLFMVAAASWAFAAQELRVVLESTRGG
jgi:hypothetical protein